MNVGQREYWFLDSVVEFELPLGLLTSPVLEETLNRRGHGLDYAEVVKTLLYLFEMGYLFAQRMSNFLSRRRVIRDSVAGKPIPRRLLGQPFTPTRGELEAGLRRKEPIDYGLTAQGGAKWESIAQPNWKHYAQIHHGDLYQQTSERAVEVLAMDKALGEQYLFFAKKYPDLFVLSSATWNVLTPWEATYWKRLPMGHQLQMKCHEHPSVLYQDEAFNTWYDSIKSWYTDPYG